MQKFKVNFEPRLIDEEMEKRITNIIRRSKSEGNNTCFVLHLGDNGFFVRGGVKYPASAVFLSLTIEDDIFIFNSNTGGAMSQTHEFQEM